MWVPDHCYGEFYLVDDEGQGHWIPANIATAKREFGNVSDPRPILQKGDNFKVPELDQPQRYASEILKGVTGRGSGSPSVTWHRNLLPPN